MFSRTLKVLAAIVVAAASLTACSKVPTGHVGVKVFLLGGDKGVDSVELGTGRYWIGINEELHLFPTFTQNHTWSGAERLSFQTKEGLVASADIGISYFVRPDKVTTVFQKYRKGIDEITSIFIRNMVRDALVKQASVLSIDAVYGEGKAALIEAVQAEVARQTEPIGIVVEKIYWVGDLGLPPSVVESINLKIQATQITAQRQNEIAQSKAEAEKRREQAKGEADAVLALATAEADAIRLKGEALRENPAVIDFEKIAKWNGTLPQVTGGATPFISLK